MRDEHGSGGSHCSAGLGDRPGGDSLLSESTGGHPGKPEQVCSLVEVCLPAGGISWMGPGQSWLRLVPGASGSSLTV